MSTRQSHRLMRMSAYGRAAIPFRSIAPSGAQLLPRFCFIFSTAWSMLKLAARWRGGNSLNVSRNLTVAAWAAKIRYGWEMNQS